MIAEREGLVPGQVLVGNGGDELIFDTFLAWGGPGRTFLNFPPTFSVYCADAQMTGTRVVDVARSDSFDVAIDAALEAISCEDPDLIVVTSPNNPTGNVIERGALERMLDATDALVLLDEAYIEFAERTSTELLAYHGNLAILRTFSKAYALAGVRLGYLLASEAVISEYLKVRQPYSVDRLSQAVGEETYRSSDIMERRVADIKHERARLFERLGTVPDIEVYPSEANYLLVRVPDAHRIWEGLYERHGVLVRDFSGSAGLEDCLRVTVGTQEEDNAFLDAFIDEIERSRR